MYPHLHQRVEALHGPGSRFSLGLAQVGRPEQNLAVQVAALHHVGIDNAERAHAGGGQVLQHRAAQPARAHHQHPGRFQPLLPGLPNFGKLQVAAVGVAFFGAKHRSLIMNYGR